MDRPKVTLVGPVTWRGVSEGTELQLGLLSLAAVLRTQGLEATLVDLNLLPARGSVEDRALEAILERAPDIVGFGSICSSYPLTLRLARAVKRARPSVTVILGGPQASVVDRQTLLTFREVDFILRGEAEESLPALLEALAGRGNLGRVGGLTYRHGRRIVRTPNAPPIEDLDALPLPAYDLYPDLSGRSWLPLEAGRGCPFSCRFCSTNDFFRRRFRLKSAEILVNQMNLLSARYGVRAFQLTHDMFTVDRKRVAEFCEVLLRQNEQFGWRCSARTDCVDEPLLALMARAGCEGMFFGIETGSPRLQKVIDKNLDLTESRRVLDAADRMGIETTASLITGYPGETFEDLDQTVQFFGDMVLLDRCDPQLHLLSPLAETPLETLYREHLVYDGAQSDISGIEGAIDVVDELLVAVHRDLFPNFYALPCPVSRRYLGELRGFLLGLAARAKGLLAALHVEAGGLRAVFDAWRATGNRSNYQTWEFFAAFLNFVGIRYLRSPAVTVMWRLYTALAAQPDGSAGPGTEPCDRIRLREKVRVVTVEGDVAGTLTCLREGRTRVADLLRGVRTLALQESSGRRNIIRELPPLSAIILQRCAGPVTEAELMQDLTEAGITVEHLAPAQYLSHALEVLERQGLIHWERREAAGGSR